MYPYTHNTSSTLILTILFYAKKLIFRELSATVQKAYVVNYSSLNLSFLCLY